MAASNDLVLVCRDGKTVEAFSEHLLNASRNIAFKEILELTMAERRDGELARLHVPDDGAEAWSTCVAVLQSQATETLTWGNMLGILQLSDKYELRAVLKGCQNRIVSHVVENFLPGPKANATIQGPEPWQFITSASKGYFDDAAVNVQDCIDIAVALYNGGLMPAYMAMVGTWVSRFRAHRLEIQEMKSIGNYQIVQAMNDEFNARLRKIRTSLENGPLCPAKQKLTWDVLHGIAVSL